MDLTVAAINTEGTESGRSKMEDINGGDVTSASESPATSPSSVTVTSGKVKFFCSHGGKILPRPTDGTLKYVGGETRVVAVPRSVTFSELMKKISDLFDGEYILKYQIASEDLDSLVSVKSNEDINHFLDEYDRLERGGGSKLRTFLFPTKPITIETHTPLSVLGPHAVEQRFIDAINGIVRPMNNSTSKPPTGSNRLKSYSPSPSDASSPQSLSPRSLAHIPTTNQDNSLMSNLQSRLTRMPKVHSSPNLSSLGGTGQTSSGTSVANSCVHHQQRHCCHCPSPQHQLYHHGYQFSSKPHDHNIHSHPHGWESPTRSHDHHNQGRHGYHSPTKPQDHHLHPYPQPVFGGGEYGRVAFGHGPRNYHSPSCHYRLLRPYPGSGGHSKWGHLEQYATAAYGASSQFIRAGSPEV